MADSQTGSEDDEFGLPEVRLKPRGAAAEAGRETSISTDQPLSDFVEEVSVSGSSGYSASEDAVQDSPPPTPESGWEPSDAPRLLYLLIPVLTILLALKGYFYFNVVPDQEAEPKQATPKQTTVPLVKPQKMPQTLPEPEKPHMPTTVILSEQTGRFHVVIKSGLDKAVIIKEASALNANGLECMVIPANASSPFNRLVLFSTEDLQQAQLKADSLRPTFGAGIWVLKY